MTTVSTLAQFTAAVAEKNTAPAIVVIKGVITGSAKVRIASNKSIIGLPGSGGLRRPVTWGATALTTTQASRVSACTSGSRATLSCGTLSPPSSRLTMEMD